MPGRTNYRKILHQLTGRAVRKVLTGMGKDSVEFIRFLVGTPVQKASDGSIVRSEPGEAPRKEKGMKAGGYQRSITYHVKPKAETVEELSVYTFDARAQWFEDGTENMEPRPHWGEARKKLGSFQKEFEKRLAAEFKRQRAGKGK